MGGQNDKIPIQDGIRTPYWKTFWNAITHLPVDQFGRNSGGRIPHLPLWGCHSNSRCLATAHWTFSSYGRLEAEPLNQFLLTLYTTPYLELNVSHVTKCEKNSNSRWRTAAILENVGNAITRSPTDRSGRNLGGRIPSCPRHGHHDAVAMVTAVA